MARHKNEQWNLTEPGTNGYTHGTIHCALLMDIRDELQTLNRLLGCSNFIAVPSILRGIRAKIPTRKRRAARALDIC